MSTVFNRVGPYRVIRSIGHGGMASVFLAVDTRGERHVALKLVPRSADREAMEVVQAEQFGAQLQRQFSAASVHVPAVYEYGTDEESGYFFIAMEYLDGENLSEVIARGPLPVARAVAIAIELCRFLEHAHAFEMVIDGRSLRSLLHLDLKPRNVRITSAQRVKVLDFGIAKALSLSRKVTRNDFGSVAYLSPERLETGEVDAGADFWAVGVILHEMASGTPPFRASDTRRLERLILSRRPPPPLPAHYPIGLQAIVVRLLGPAPAERYASAAEIRGDLERLQAGRRTVAEERGWPGAAFDEATTRRTRPSPEDDEKTRRTRTAGTAASTEPSPGPPAAAAARAAPAAGRRFLGRARRLVAAVLVLSVLGLFANELRLAGVARQAAHAAAMRELDGMGISWAEYDRLVADSYLGFGLQALEDSLVRRTSDLADRVMANYRTPSPTVREAQWMLARDALARAVAVEPTRELRAALRYCEGQLSRINGEAKKSRRELEAARRDLTDAVVAFREAAELRPGWPDPFLGLARTFIYGLEDVDRAADALRQAQQHGHEPSEREIAQLADGYRVHGDTLVRSAREVAGLPQERDYLARAVEAYREALGLYSAAGSFANVPANIRLAQRSLLQIEARVARLSPSPAASEPPVESDQPAPLVPQGFTSTPGAVP